MSPQGTGVLCFPAAREDMEDQPMCPASAQGVSSIRTHLSMANAAQAVPCQHPLHMSLQGKRPG